MLATITSLPGLCEPFAALSHFLGALAVLLLAPSLLRAAGADRTARWVLGLFAGAVALQLTASGLYHTFEFGTGTRALFERIDHAAIWLIVTGCFLPLWLFLLRERRGSTVLLAGVVLTSLAGLALETAFADLIPKWVTVILYVGFGSIGTPIALWLVVTRGLRETLLFFCCGVCFSIGALIQLPAEAVLIPGVVEYHELVHLFVLAGLFCHWAFVRKLAGRASAGQEPLPLPEGVRLAEQVA